MKRTKIALSAFAVLAIVSSLLAFKVSASLGQGNVYCTSTCPVASKVDFRVDNSGINTIPCGANVQPYVMGFFGGSLTCEAVTPWKGTNPTFFISTATGN